MKDFFTGVAPEVLEGSFESGTLFHKVEKHTTAGFPDLREVKIALLGIRETRGTKVEELHFKGVRKALYRLYSGEWRFPIVDLGDILAGESLDDTYFALTQVVTTLVKQGTIPLLLGGAAHLMYANYRAYDALDQFVNMALIAKQLDLYKRDELENFMPRIIAAPPTRLFDFSLIGFQQYFVSQASQELMEKLYFERMRLGKTMQHPLEAEPLIRNADMVGVDLSVANLHTAPGCAEVNVNGMDGITLCALARFAGLSNKVSSFGIYGYAPHLDVRTATAQLIAQLLWYFMEGFSLRRLEYPQIRREALLKYHVPIDGRELVFYKNKQTDRWWMQVDIAEGKEDQQQLIPCSYADYLDTTQENIPDKWWRYYQKLL